MSLPSFHSVLLPLSPSVHRDSDAFQEHRDISAPLVWKKAASLALELFLILFMLPLLSLAIIMMSDFYLYSVFLRLKNAVDETALDRAKREKILNHGSGTEQNRISTVQHRSVNEEKGLSNARKSDNTSRRDETYRG